MRRPNPSCSGCRRRRRSGRGLARAFGRPPRCRCAASVPVLQRLVCGLRRCGDPFERSPMSTIRGEETPDDRDPESSFYRRVLHDLEASGVPVLVGGAYALAHYTGIERRTKDFDLFLRRADYHRAAQTLDAQGFRTELTFPHWLGKVHAGSLCVDLIFNSGNGLTRVDDAWFEHAVDGEVLGLPAKLVPVEEMIWSKAFVMERERYDGADVAHLLLARAASLDWPRLLERMGANWRILLSHLVLFGFIYPAERTEIPAG